MVVNETVSVSETIQHLAEILGRDSSEDYKPPFSLAEMPLCKRGKICHSLDMSESKLAEEFEQNVQFMRQMLINYDPYPTLRDSPTLSNDLTRFDDLVKVMRREGHAGRWMFKQRYICRIRRNDFGSWLGYVGVPVGHPCFEMTYDDVHYKYPDLEVHGGLTFSGHRQEWARDNVWFLGFDCAHSDDLQLYFHNIRHWVKECGVTYKDKDYVTRETNRLAIQLHKIEKEI